MFTDLFNKVFIRVNNSLITALILFIKKLKRGLRFCINYRGLNRIIKKDRYLFPLIYETLRNINKALVIKKYIDPKNKMPAYFY